MSGEPARKNDDFLIKHKILQSFWLAQNRSRRKIWLMDEKMIGVYIMGNANLTFYTGVTNNLVRRILEHKKGKQKGFTQKYNLKICLYYEFCETMRQAIIREKQIKDLNRKEKINPH